MPPVAANLVLEGELRSLTRLFDSVATEFLVLKGVPFARRLDLRIDERRLHDNDVLVPRPDVHRAAAVLAEMGYQPRPFRSLDAALKDDFQLPFYRRHETGIEVALDLHWAPFWPRLYPVDEDLIWSHTEFVELRGQPIRVFDRPLTLIHLAAHYAQHFFAEERIVRQFATAWNRWGSEIDPDELVDLARQLNLQPVLAYAFAVAQSKDLLEQPSPAMRSRKAEMLHRRYPTGRSPDTIRNAQAATLLSWSLAPARRIPSQIKALAFPSIETLAAMKQQPVSKGLYLEYAVRPLRPLLRRRTRRPSHSQANR